MNKALKAVRMIYANSTKHDWPKDIWDAVEDALAQPEQRSVSEHLEPVAGLRCKVIENCKSCQHSVGRLSCSLANKDFDSRERSPAPPDWCPLPLYTTPYVATPRPQRKPLTDEQILEMLGLHDVHLGIVDFVRTIEAAHGIKGD